VNVVAMLFLVLGALSGLGAWKLGLHPGAIAAGPIGFAILSFSPRIAKQWERAVVLRLGRFAGLRGPGIFFMVPFFDRVSSVLDLRVITTLFNAEQTLTRDTVPVDVDAVLFWHVHDAERAALEV
jgi:regulator of protease activity HflC (stomatin/prohibitin superfamily)